MSDNENLEVFESNSPFVEETTSEELPLPTKEDVPEQKTEVVTTSETTSETTVPTEPEWTPNYKYRVKDKEYEMDEFIRPVVSKDNYEKVLELYTKAGGLEHAKSRGDRLEQEFKKIEEQYTNQSKALGYLGHLVKNKDIATIAKELNIDDDTLINFALERANYKVLPEDQRRELDKRYEEKQRLYRLETENYHYQQQQTNNVIQARLTELDAYLSTGPLANVVADFDNRKGSPGKFRETVCKYGAMVERSNGQSVSIPEAVNMFLDDLGIDPNRYNTASVNQYSNQGMPASQPMQMTANQMQMPNAQKPVLPNLKSSGNSPVKKQPRSCADLEKLAQEYEG